MKKILFIILLLLMIFSAYSADASGANTYLYTISGEPFYANFQSLFDGIPNGNTSHNGGDIWGHEYTDNDIVGILGVAPLEKENNIFTGKNKFTISCNITSLSASGKKWVYTTLSDSGIEIPLGLDFVLRYNTWDDDQGKTEKIEHLGYKYKDGMLPVRDNSFDVTPSSDWASFWFDIVLVIPPEPLWEQMGIKYGAASDYQAELELNITDASGNIDKSFTLILRGYYEVKDQDESGGYINFTVSPEGAKAIPISMLGGSSRIIGTYYYESTPIKSSFSPNPDVGFKTDTIVSPIYLFVSSSPNFDKGGGYFYLWHEKADKENNSSSAVKIPFRIGLIRSNNNDVDEILWFNGNDLYSNSTPVGLQATVDYSSTRYGMEDIVILRDEGDILFQLGHYPDVISDDYVRQNFISGNYSARIYIHLYTTL